MRRLFAISHPHSVRNSGSCQCQLHLVTSTSPQPRQICLRLAKLAALRTSLPALGPTRCLFPATLRSLHPLHQLDTLDLSFKLRLRQRYPPTQRHTWLPACRVPRVQRPVLRKLQSSLAHKPDMPRIPRRSSRSTRRGRSEATARNGPTRCPTMSTMPIHHYQRRRL